MYGAHAPPHRAHRSHRRARCQSATDRSEMQKLWVLATIARPVQVAITWLCLVLNVWLSTPAASSAEPSAVSSWSFVSCKGALDSICPLGGGTTTRQCDVCVGVHQPVLRRAGCTSAQVQAWCHSQAPGVLTNQTISGFPHLYDVFHPSSPTNGGMIFLHGGGGEKKNAEISLGTTSLW